MMNLILADLANYNSIRNNLVIRLVNKKNVKPDRVTIPLIADIVATLGIHIEGNEDETATAVITNDSLERYNKTAIEVYTDALGNLENRYSLDSMHDILASMIPDFMLDGVPKGLYVLNVDNKCNGAACIFNRNIMDAVRKKMGTSNIIIIPSSIHETIIVNMDMFPHMTVKDVTDMIHEVNGTELQPNDLLSEYAYRYDYDHHNVVLA